MTDAAAPETPEDRERDLFYRACKNSEGFCKLFDIETWQVLGRGKGGRVARVWSYVRRAPVVVKVLEHCGEATLARIAGELRIVDQIVSEYVVRVFGAHDLDGVVCIEMEYVEGPTLARVEANRQAEGEWFSMAEAAELGLEICKGLEAIHVAGAIHRDIKPQNVVLPTSRRSRAVIVDFGIARLIAEDRQTFSGEFKGTPEYSAPEFFKRPRPGEEPPPLGPECDIYSFGVLLYELFTGSKPFDATTSSECAMAHLHLVPPPPQYRNPALPKELCDMLLRMLMKGPESRPALSTIVQTLQGVAASPPASSVEPARPLPRRRNIVGVGVAASVGLGLVVLGLSLRGPAASQGVGAAPERPASAPPGSAPASPPVAGLAGTPRSPEGDQQMGEGFRVALEADAVLLTNKMSSRATGISIVLVGARGERHRASGLDETVEPGGTLAVPFAFFDPPIASGARLARAEIELAGSPSGRLTLTLPLK